jgi:hypothetical protein
MTLIVGIIVALTFLFGFGNVFTLALHLGVPVWFAPLVAPAVDLGGRAALLLVVYRRRNSGARGRERQFPSLPARG